jgi:GNAT superfamily N-acetyltransferase/acyl carrier protein
LESEKIRKAVLATIASIAPDADLARILPDQPLREQIHLDSMDWLNVVVDLHARLAIEIPESDYGELATLDSMVAYVASRKARRRGKPGRSKAAAPEQLPSTRHLVNGTPVSVRPMRPEDASIEADFVRQLSSETRYKRFMLTLRELSPAKLEYLTEVDQVGHVALVAAVDRDGKQALVGVVRYIVDPAGTGCEFAIAIDDAWQGCGLGGVLMHALIGIARSRGLATMEGIVLATNNRMLRFTRQLGFRQEPDPEDRTTVRVVREL